MAEILAPNHIAQQAGQFTPQLQNQFSIEIHGLPGQDSDTLILGVAGGAIPESSFEKVTIDYVNKQVHMAGKIIVGTTSLRVRDFIDSETRDALWRWYQLTGDPKTGSMGLPADYKRDGTIVLFGPDGSHERLWKMEGLFIESANWGDLDHATVDNLVMEATLSVDTAYRDI